ncbi:MAG: iron transporter [Lachnospiraceae bacterium]|nr:iron transporter [Lachnospiraceae bacterium]
MKKKVLALLAAAAMTICSAMPVMAEEAGFEEFPIGEEQDVDVLHVAAVYFQPVPMEPAAEAGLTVEESNLHIEADISANENELGFGVGDWVPYLSVDYKVIASSGDIAAEGTFMPMSASDGPHYGANILLEEADTYTLTFTIHNPSENGYLLHIDEETGVPGKFWSEPIEVTFENWEYVPQEW